MASIYHHIMLGKRPTGGILCYHNVIDSSNIRMAPLSIDCFEDHLNLLSSEFEVVSLSEYCKLLHDTEYGNLNGKVVITFDDGYKDNYENAIELLIKYGLPATFFLNSNFIRGKFKFCEDPDFDAMSERQVLEVSENKLFDIGGHTSDHIVCSAIQTDEEFIEQVVIDKSQIEKMINKEVEHFAFPNGQGGDISNFVYGRLPEIGYSSSCSTFFKNNNLQKDRFSLNRIMIWPGMDSASLKKCLQGDYNYLYILHSLMSIYKHLKNNKLYYKL